MAKHHRVVILLALTAALLGGVPDAASSDIAHAAERPHTPEGTATASRGPAPDGVAEAEEADELEPPEVTGVRIRPPSLKG